MSWFSQTSFADTTENSIPVITGFRPVRSAVFRPPPVRLRIRRENKCVQALSLPTILVYNMRSIWAKIHNFSDDMIERSADVSFLSEVWEKSECKKHKSKIEEMLEMKGISYISTPRPGVKRGGGAALALNPNRFSLSKLNISVPKPLEVVWGLLRPNEATGNIKKIILCSFYSPPNSRKNNLLVDHISVTYNSLKMQHPCAGTLICGDKNNLDEKRILALDPNFQQIVTEHTRKNKILTIVITDLQSFFNVPQIIPPVPVDVPGKGVPSDHNGVLGVPLTHATLNRKSQVRRIKVRPLPESLIAKFGSILVHEEWTFLHQNMSSTEMVAAFENHTSSLVDTIFPEKNVTISNFDQPFITEELKMLRRQRIRIYNKQGRSQKYLEVRNHFETKLKLAAKKYWLRVLQEAASGKSTNSYAALKKLELGSVEKKFNFTLPSHAEEGLLNLSIRTYSLHI